MFNNNKKQYINVLKQDKQLRIDYKIIQDNKDLKRENSTFILQNENMAPDALFKLTTLQKNIPNSYITTLYTSSNQTIQLKENINTTDHEAILLTDTLSITVPKNDILKYSNYFKDSGLDFLISPFTILYQLIQNNPIKNSLNIIVYDNKLFIIILDQNKQINITVIKDLTPFENIKKSNFYNDEIIGQKLYDEVHFLEIQQSLSDIIEDYYKNNDGADFLSKANFYYTIKQLTDEQLDLLHEAVMTEISYTPISIDDYLYNISQKINVSNYSLVTPRTKKNQNTMILWLLILSISILAVSGTLYYKMFIDIEQKVEVIKTVSKPIEQNNTKQPKVLIVKKEIVKLPNHTLKNNQIVQQTLMLFDMIPYDAILKELEINDDSSTFVCNFILNSTSANDMRDKLLNVYNESKIILKHENKAILSTIITNNQLLNTQDINSTKNYIDTLKYKEHKFMHIAEVTKYLEQILIKNSKLKFISKQKDKFVTYNFNIESTIKTPQDFFDFIESLNKKDIPLNISYPLEFAKINNAILVKYNLQFHQENKKDEIKPKN